jgi:hypothetical protein
MTVNLENLLKDMQQQRQQCHELERSRDRAREQYKQADNAFDAAVGQYAQLQAVFDYCLTHNCDETYAKMMLSDADVLKQHVKQNENFLVNSVGGMFYSKSKPSLSSNQTSKTTSWFDKLFGRH